MTSDIGIKYDRIAQWWHDHHHDAVYGVRQIEKAISYCKKSGSALDVGCGSGERIITTLLKNQFTVTGIDASSKMIEIARSLHPHVDFHIADICEWETKEKYDLIVAWDSIFHLPLNWQKPVVSKLCELLNPEGIFIYTFGDDTGEHDSEWHEEQFHYSTLGISENLHLIMEKGCQCRHLELDQYPEKHVYIIVQKTFSPLLP